MKKIFNAISAAWRALPFTGDVRPRVSVLELTGVIGAVGGGRKGLALSRLEKVIEEAFAPDGLDAVALAINSPGGSPVQSRLILQKIRRLSEQKKVPVLAFIEDVGASGGYILALAADEIYADESSIVGSIGVISSGFGFHEAIARYGIERRVYTAGTAKSKLDPFQPEQDEDVEKLTILLGELHEQFIALVNDRRGSKLNPADGEDLFNGDIWVGPAAKKRGLIDGTAQLGEFLDARFGKTVKVKRYALDGGSLLKRLFSGDAAVIQSGVGPVFDADAMIGELESRAHWARFGL